MFFLHYSEEKNRIYIELRGELSEAEFNAYKNNIIDLIDGARPGFTVLADLSLCDRSVIENSDNFNVIREYGAKRGFKANALVLGEDAYKTYTSALKGNNNNIYYTKDEADSYLDTLQ